MVLLSFSVMKDKVLSGEKSRSMRRANDNPNGTWNRVFEKWKGYLYAKQNGVEPFIPKKPEIKLQIYWKSRSKNGEKLFDAILINITRKKLKDLTVSEMIKDGFSPHVGPKIGGIPTPDFTNVAHDCYSWFSKTYKIPLEMDTSHLPIIYTSKPYSDEILNFEVFIIEFEREDDPFEVCNESSDDECEYCCERREITLQEDGSATCRECSARHYGYRLKGFEAERKAWETDLHEYECAECSTFFDKTMLEKETLCPKCRGKTE